MAGIFRKPSNHETTTLSDAELRNSYIDFYDKRIEELENEYKELIQKPYQAGRLSEIISELGRIWNERLRYQDVEGEINSNGAKNLQQVRKDVSDIVQEVKSQIEISIGSNERLSVFAKGLEKLIAVVGEWEPRLE